MMLILLAPLTILIRVLIAWRQPPTPKYTRTTPSTPAPQAEHDLAADVPDLNDWWATDNAVALLNDWWDRAYGGTSTTQEQQ